MSCSLSFFISTDGVGVCNNGDGNGNDNGDEALPEISLSWILSTESTDDDPGSISSMRHTPSIDDESGETGDRLGTE
jgi:hypothetical protein